MHTTRNPIATSGTYAHTDGTVGEYTWVDGNPQLLRVGADHADIDSQRAAEQVAIEAHRAGQQQAADAEMRRALLGSY